MSSTFAGFFLLSKRWRRRKEQSNNQRQCYRRCISNISVWMCVCVLCTHNTRIYGKVWSPNIRSNVTQKTSFFSSTAFQSSAFWIWFTECYLFWRRFPLHQINIDYTACWLEQCATDIKPGDLIWMIPHNMNIQA